MSAPPSFSGSLGISACASCCEVRARAHSTLRRVESWRGGKIADMEGRGRGGGDTNPRLRVHRSAVGRARNAWKEVPQHDEVRRRRVTKTGPTSRFFFLYFHSFDLHPPCHSRSTASSSSTPRFPHLHLAHITGEDTPPTRWQEARTPRIPHPHPPRRPSRIFLLIVHTRRVPHVAFSIFHLHSLHAHHATVAGAETTPTLRSWSCCGMPGGRAGGRTNVDRLVVRVAPLRRRGESSGTQDLRAAVSPSVYPCPRAPAATARSSGMLPAEGAGDARLQRIPAWRAPPGRLSEMACVVVVWGGVEKGVVVWTPRARAGRTRAGDTKRWRWRWRISIHTSTERAFGSTTPAPYHGGERMISVPSQSAGGEGLRGVEVGGARDFAWEGMPLRPQRLHHILE
ncbi:hypothetical protein B0H11DRAFT_2193034 [Mycena galericulata]|nr:hypothetical protein B0H11DRAFT_2193034 [Mycena galericulata]